MVAQPQPLTEHFPHRVAHRIFNGIARHRLDLGTGNAQPLLECIGGIQHVAHRTLMGREAPAAALQEDEAGDRHHGGYHEYGDGHGGLRRRIAESEARSVNAANACAGASAGLTGLTPIRTISPLMSAESSRQSVPETLDAWRQVTARRGFEGRVPLASFPRLAGLLVDPEGDVRFSLEFDRDSLGVPYVALDVTTELPLQCQRTLERFMLPVTLDQRMGLIRDESEEPGLPPDYEPLMVPESGELRPLDVVEDELILAIPVVPVMPGTDAVDREWVDGAAAAEPERPNPFAALAGFKKKSD